MTTSPTHATPPPSRAARPIDIRQPFTAKQATAAGITRAQLRGPSYEKLFRGVYLAADTSRTPLLMARAAIGCVAGPAVITRHTAAQLWGGVVPHSPDTHLAIREGQKVTIPGIRASRHREFPAHRLCRGLHVSTPEATFLQMAPLLTLVDLVVLGDSLVGRKATTPATLVAAAASAKGRGARQARAAAALVRAGVESPMESRLRLLLVFAGLPEPTVNHILRDEYGNWIARFDLAYPELKLAVEYDGRQHAEDDEQWEHDVDRRDYTDDEEWRVLVVLSKGIYKDPARTVARVTRQLRRRGVSVRPTSAWQRHFPSRA